MRYPAGGIDEPAQREIRRIKARDGDRAAAAGRGPDAHLKLGRGGLWDVEWIVQLLQLQHAARRAGAAHADARSPPWTPPSARA